MYDPLELSLIGLSLSVYIGDVDSKNIYPIYSMELYFSSTVDNALVFIVMDLILVFIFQFKSLILFVSNNKSIIEHIKYLSRSHLI